MSNVNDITIGIHITKWRELKPKRNNVSHKSSCQTKTSKTWKVKKNSTTSIPAKKYSLERWLSRLKLKWTPNFDTCLQTKQKCFRIRFNSKKKNHMKRQFLLHCQMCWIFSEHRPIYSGWSHSIWFRLLWIERNSCEIY